jgi:hypothetical protein
MRPQVEYRTALAALRQQTLDVVAMQAGYLFCMITIFMAKLPDTRFTSPAHEMECETNYLQNIDVTVHDEWHGMQFIGDGNDSHIERYVCLFET